MTGSVSEFEYFVATYGLADDCCGYAWTFEYVLLLVESDACGANDGPYSACAGDDSE